MLEDYSAAGLIPAHVFPILSKYLFVQIKLEADLWLQVRGDEEARLMPCPCTIPVLDREGESLNHAFTMISEAYETKRRSHSGNVFERAYALSGSNGWKSLDDLRLQAIQTFTAKSKDLAPGQTTPQSN